MNIKYIMLIVLIIIGVLIGFLIIYFSQSKPMIVTKYPWIDNTDQVYIDNKGRCYKYRAVKSECSHPQISD